MKTPMLVVMTSKTYTADEALWLRDAGITHACYSSPGGDDWQRGADHLHAAGLRVVGWMPQWAAVPPDEAYRFRTHAGAGSIGGSISYWRPEEEAMALAYPPSEEVIKHLDTVLVNPLGHDCPYPTAWIGCESNDFRYTREFWSWDAAAQATWAEFSGGKDMPRFAELNLRGQPTVDMEFYRWYQRAWLSRVMRVSDWALERGVKDIWTWATPHNHWTGENMSMSSADSFSLFDEWGQHVKAAGAHPCIVMACLWPTYEAMKSTCIAAVETLIRDTGHDVIIGAETYHSQASIPQVFGRFGPKGRSIGAAGIFASDGCFWAEPGQAATQDALRRERQLWDEEMARREAAHNE